jgi:lipopolysaccharide export LptBFGC system permease protein LptF
MQEILLNTLKPFRNILSRFLKLSASVLDRLGALLPEEARAFKWTRLDEYIVRNFIQFVIGSLFLFIVIFQMTQIFQDLRSLPPKADPWLLVQYYTLGSAYWINVFQPFAFSFACVYILSQMVHLRELIAIVSTGTSVYRIGFYLLVFTLFYYCFVVFFMTDNIIAPAYERSTILKEIIFHGMDLKSLDHLKDNNNFSIFGSSRLIYIIGNYNAVERELTGISIIQFRNVQEKDLSDVPLISNENIWLITNVQELTKLRHIDYPNVVNIALRVDANQAVWNPKEKRWDFDTGTIRYVDDRGETFRVEPFTNRSFPFIVDPPYYFEKVWVSMDAMTYADGWRQIQKMRSSHQDYRESLARYISKFSYPIGIIFVVLAGIGIIDISRRKSSLIVNLMLSLGLFLIYYILFSAGIALSGKGQISPFLGATFGSFFFMIISVILFARVRT